MDVWDLHRLRLLRELRDRGTLTAVAEALAYSPSAISQQLAVLAKEAGQSLVEPAGRGVRLTVAGEVLAEHADRLLVESEAARDDLAALAGEVRGVVRIGGIQSAIRHLITPAVSALVTQLPGVRVEVSEVELEQALPDLRLGALDLIVSDEYLNHPRPRPSDLTLRVLHREHLRLVLPADHPEARGRRRSAPMARLASDVWVASDGGTGHHEVVVASCRSLGGFEPDLRHRSNDAQVQLGFVRALGAIALLPELQLPLDDPALAVRVIAEGEVRRQLFTLVRSGSRSPALRATLDALSDQANSL